MSNSKASSKNLELGRGKRPKLDHISVSMRMSPSVKKALEEIAGSFNCTYGGKPWIAGLLDKIGKGELIVVKAPPPRDMPPEVQEISDPELIVMADMEAEYPQAPLEDTIRSSGQDVTNELPRTGVS